MNIELLQPGQIVEIIDNKEVYDAKILAVNKNKSTVRLRMPKGTFSAKSIYLINRIIFNPDGTKFESVTHFRSDAKPPKEGMAIVGEKGKELIRDAKESYKLAPSAPTIDPVVAVLNKIKAKEIADNKAITLHSKDEFYDKDKNIMQQVSEASEEAQKRLLELKPSLKKQIAKREKTPSKKPAKPLRVVTRLYSKQGLKDKILELALAEKSNKEIADECGCHQSTVSETKAKLVKEGKLQKR